MSQKLINLSPDLKRLVDEGYSLEVIEAHVLVKDVPYLNSMKKQKTGVLICPLTLSGERTARPEDHVMHFIGEHPCNIDGSEMATIKHSSKDCNWGNGIIVNHMFSCRPASGYSDYYEKFTTYVNTIIAPVLHYNPDATAQLHHPFATSEDNIFNYRDTNTSRANIGNSVEKLKGLKIGIIGLGGTGSYVLDYISKTPIDEIHLFDGDKFYSHNAFRAPGAFSVSELETQSFKVDQFYQIYSKLRKGISAHPFNISQESLEYLISLDFIFLCIDSGQIKKTIIDFLIDHTIPFIDTGIGMEIVDGSLLGAARITAVLTPGKEGWKKRISFQETANDVYSSNIQIAEINSICAALAVIKMKKFFRVYLDQNISDYISYDVVMGDIVNEN